MMDAWMEEELAAIEMRGERRRIETWPAPGPYLERDGIRYLNLAGNDYLGLTAHPEVREAAARAAREIGPGSTASRLLAGTCALHSELETALARWKGHPAALVFSSGYLAALGVIPLLADRGDLILADRLCHACLLDAARLSGARLLRFRHNDLEDVKARLTTRAAYRRCLIVTESIFSMDGDLAPWRELLELAIAHDAMLLVDEAHAIGVAGPRGAGVTADEPSSAEHLITMGTLGKALASSGGFVTGSERLKELLINRARTFIFDTALPPPSLAAASAAVALTLRNPKWTDHVADRANRVRARLAESRLNTFASQSHIIPVRVGDNQKVMEVAAKLREQGVLVAAIRPPTVPSGTARLRLSISLAHDLRDLERAADLIARALHA